MKGITATRAIVRMFGRLVMTADEIRRSTVEDSSSRPISRWSNDDLYGRRLFQDQGALAGTFNIWGRLAVGAFELPGDDAADPAAEDVLADIQGVLRLQLEAEGGGVGAQHAATRPAQLDDAQADLAAAGDAAVFEVQRLFEREERRLADVQDVVLQREGGEAGAARRDHDEAVSLGQKQRLRPVAERLGGGLAAHPAHHRLERQLPRRGDGAERPRRQPPVDADDQHPAFRQRERLAQLGGAEQARGGELGDGAWRLQLERLDAGGDQADRRRAFRPRRRRRRSRHPQLPRPALRCNIFLLLCSITVAGGVVDDGGEGLIGVEGAQSLFGDPAHLGDRAVGLLGGGRHLLLHLLDQLLLARLDERLARPPQVARAHQRQAEVALRALVARLAVDDALQIGRRFVVLADPQLDEAEVEPQGGILGVARHQLAIERERLVVLAEAELDEAEQVARAQVVGAQGERPGHLRLRLLHVVAAQELAGAVQVRRQLALDLVRRQVALHYFASSIFSHHWHHHASPTRMRSLGCQQ